MAKGRGKQLVLLVSPAARHNKKSPATRPYRLASAVRPEFEGSIHALAPAGLTAPIGWHGLRLEDSVGVNIWVKIQTGHLIELGRLHDWKGGRVV